METQVNCVGCDELPGNILLHSSVLVSKMFEEISGLKAISSFSICKSCQTELRSSYNFRKRCREIFSLYHNEKTQSFESKTVNEQVPDPSQEDLEEYPIETVKCEQSIDSIDESYLSEEEIQTIENFNPTESSEEDQSLLPEVQNEEILEKFQCIECEKVFSKKSHLVSHQSSHENLRQFKCFREGCNSSFNVASRLIRHLRNVHQADEDEIVEIKEQTKELKPKKVHSIKEKVPKGKVQCEVCNKVLSNTRYLKEHMTLQHLKNSKYVCKELGCRKRFKIWSLLEKHMKKHSGHVDFICKFCGKGYVERKIFNSHLRKTHQISQSEIDTMNWMQSTNGYEVMDKKCKDCGQEFKAPHKLFEHRALEHGEGQRFICDFCGRVFTSKAFLLSHQKYHKGVKKKKCFKCPSIFTEEKGLRTHLRRVHKMSDEEFLALQMNGKL